MRFAGVEEGFYGEDVIAGTWLNNVKFVKPVYPEDELHINVEFIEKKAIKMKQGSLLFPYLPLMIEMKKFLRVPYP
jgi:acyl dehydratase